MSVTKALISLRPKATWAVHGTEYSDIEWLDENETKPTKEEVERELVRLKTQHEANEYQRQRASEYPS